MRILCGKRDSDVVLVVMLVDPVQLRVVKHPVNYVK